MDQVQNKVNFKIEKKSYSKGQVVILQGSNNKEIYAINSGSIEIKKCSENIQGLKDREIIAKSNKICIIETPLIFGVNNLLNSNSHDCSYITNSDCEITKYIVQSYDFLGFFRSNSTMLLKVLISMQDQAGKKLYNLKKFSDFFGLIEKINDNFMLLYLHITQTKRDKLYQKFINNGGVFSHLIEPSFLTTDNSGILEKKYYNINNDPYVKFEKNKIDFFKNLMRVKPQAFLSIISVEFNIFKYIFDSLSSINYSLNSEIIKNINSMNDKLNYFFSDKTSPFNMIYTIMDKIKKSGDVSPNFVKSIANICRNIDQINKQLGGQDYPEVYPKFDIINTTYTVTIGEKETKVGSSTENYKKLFKDSTKKILAYSTLSNDIKNKILRNIKAMNKINPDEILSKEVRVLIKNLQDDYYTLYMSLFLKTIKHPEKIPPYIKLFLYFSFIDEKTITEQQLEFIYNSLNIFTSNQNTEYSIITLYDYLLKIYNKEEEPSLSERGEFRKLVTKYFGKNQKQVVDSPKGRLEFEIDNMVNMSMRITSNNIRAFIPYLNEKSFKGVLSQILVTPKKLDVYLKRINAVDFSLFYRELTWKIPGKSELIKKEVKPYLILLPNSGLRVQMWQELVYNMRSSRARFLIPIIFNGDLLKNLIFSCGHFRWNLNKAMVSNWMDPVEGGLTGAYYDYEMSYKKNPDLTIEAKEKIKKQISSIKIDRNRFAHDYYEWLVFESEGVPKLNKILRKIFYRLVPFPRNIRDNISKLPVYSELDRKFNIIRDRDFKKIEARFKKYMDAGQMPEDLKAFLELMQK